jgi:type II secretory pathway component GspD/PulD (secretin)
MAVLAAALTPLGVSAQDAGEKPGDSSQETPAGENGAAAKPEKQAKSDLVSNVFVESDLRQALSDIALTAGRTVIADATVRGTVSVELTDVPFETALSIVLAVGNYEFRKMPEGYYLIGLAHPENPNFPLLSETATYRPSFQNAEAIAAQLSTAFTDYVRVPRGGDTITITAGRRTMDRILEDIAKIDQPVKRVMLEVLITEASSELLDQFDFSWTWRKFGIVGTNEAMDLTYSGVSAKDVATMVSLIADGKAELRANPRVMALEGEEASIDIGREAYYSIVTGPVNYPYTTLQKIVTGISLKMTPHVSQDGQITVDLEPSVSDVVGTGTGGLPVNTVRKVKTSMRVRDGESIIIGGMTYESSSRRDRRVPILGDMPLIGGLFRGHRTETKKTEVVIMITPRVVTETPPPETDTEPPTP